MSKKLLAILFGVLLTLGVGLGVLIWWLLRADNLYETILLEGEGIGDVQFTAAMTRIEGKGSMFWWFYPTLSAAPTTRPILLWLHGATGTSPSFLANFGMIGPYDANLNRRNDSLVDEYNLLFVDAPLGTGFSTSTTDEVPNLEENVEHLLRTVQSFYDLHGQYKETPLYICGQADGAQLAVPLAKRLYEENNAFDSLKGIILGNPIVSPALVLTKLGFYLEELGYIDARGRTEIESFSNTVTEFVETEAYGVAFDLFSNLGHIVNDAAGAVAVNLDYIVQKLTRTTYQDYIMETNYIKRALKSDININEFMENVVAPALGIPEPHKYDQNRLAAVLAFKPSYMKPIVSEVEYILQNTNMSVNIYNGNLDAVSNTPGQLEWINNLEWSGQAHFLNRLRLTIVFNQLIEGYFRESERLRFYWINVAGQMVPLDNPVALRRVLNRILN